jgi:hypothetical protein
LTTRGYRDAGKEKNAAGNVKQETTVKERERGERFRRLREVHADRQRVRGVHRQRERERPRTRERRGHQLRGTGAARVSKLSSPLRGGSQQAGALWARGHNL